MDNSVGLHTDSHQVSFEPTLSSISSKTQKSSSNSVVDRLGKSLVDVWNVLKGVFGKTPKENGSNQGASQVISYSTGTQQPSSDVPTTASNILPDTTQDIIAHSNAPLALVDQKIQAICHTPRPLKPGPSGTKSSLNARAILSDDVAVMTKKHKDNESTSNDTMDEPIAIQSSPKSIFDNINEADDSLFSSCVIESRKAPKKLQFKAVDPLPIVTASNKTDTRTGVQTRHAPIMEDISDDDTAFFSAPSSPKIQPRQTNTLPRGVVPNIKNKIDEDTHLRNQSTLSVRPKTPFNLRAKNHLVKTDGPAANVFKSFRQTPSAQPSQHTRPKQANRAPIASTSTNQVYSHIQARTQPSSSALSNTFSDSDSSIESDREYWRKQEAIKQALKERWEELDRREAKNKSFLNFLTLACRGARAPIVSVRPGFLHTGGIGPCTTINGQIFTG